MNLTKTRPQMSKQWELPGTKGVKPLRETKRGSPRGDARKRTLRHKRVDGEGALAPEPSIRTEVSHSKQGSPGVDGMTVDALPAYLREHWPRIREQLLAGSYQPSLGKSS